MTIAAQYPIVIVEGNGSQTSFNYAFEVPYQLDGVTPAVLVSTYTDPDAPTVLDPSLYTISNVGVESGGVVVYPLSGSPIPVATFICIERNLAYAQGSAFPNTAFQPQQVEYALDQLELQVQQLAAGSGTGGGGGGGSGVVSFNGRDGTVTLFSSDVTGALGYTPLDKAGDTATGKINFAPSGTDSLAGVNLGEGVDPSAPVDGDIWATTTKLRARINGTTYDLAPSSSLFDENTGFNLGGTTVDQSLVERLTITRTPQDYGCLGDGSDDTAAWNLMVADVNAGLIHAIFVPAGLYFLPGDTTAFTQPCDLYGTGNRSVISTTNGTGTSILINFDALANPALMSIHDLKFVCSVQPKVRQMLQVSYATEPLQLSIYNISMDGAFSKGIGLHNCVSGRFTNITLNMYNWTTNEWGWNLTATDPHYNVDLFWAMCTVAGAQYSWKMANHQQGLVWFQCEAGFSGWGWYSINTNEPTSNVPNGPEAIWVGCSGECQRRIIYANNWSNVKISDNWFQMGTVTLTGSIAIELANTFVGDVQNNFIGGPPGVVWHAVRVDGVVNWPANPGNPAYPITRSVKVHDNIIRVLTGIGVWCSGYAYNVQAYNNHYDEPVDINPGVTYAKPFEDTTSSNTNTHRGTTYATSTSVNSYFNCQGGEADAGPISISAVATFTRVAEAPVLPAYAGEQFRIQWQFSMQSGSQIAQSPSFRVREYNHRPSGPSPYQVMSYAFNTNAITGTQFLCQSASPPVAGQSLGGAIGFTGEAVVKIVGTAFDALFVLEAKTDLGTADAVNMQFQVDRL